MQRRSENQTTAHLKLASQEVTIAPAISVKTIEHLGIIAGLIAENNPWELLNERLGINPREQVSPGMVESAGAQWPGVWFVPLGSRRAILKGQSTRAATGRRGKFQGVK